MAGSPRINFRVPAHLFDAVQARAQERCQTLTEYLRTLIEADTGTPIGDIKQGFAANPAALEKAVEARWKKGRKRKKTKKIV